MNDNANKTAVVTAIWNNPARVFGIEFKQSGRYWESKTTNPEYDKRGKIRLLLVADGGNITVFYNGASRPEKCDVFTYLSDYVLHTGGFRETLERCAQVYGLELRFTKEEREAIGRQQLAREVAPSLVEALRANPGGKAGRYLTERRGLTIDEHFGELSEQSIQRVRDALRLRGKTYAAEDFEALGLTVERANAGYNLVIPYVVNGSVVGLMYRNTNAELREGQPKYLYSKGMTRGAFCDRLTIGEPAVFVEGPLDAIRLQQACITNVVAMGGASMTDATADLLKSRNIGQITYVPDLEYNEDGTQKTELIQRAVDRFLSARVDGEPVVTNLYVAELYADDGADLRGLKVDADSFGQEHGPAALAEVVDLAAAWWEWETEQLVTWAKSQDTTNIAAFQSKFDKIYNRCANPYERERIKQYIDSKENRAVFRAFGVTPQALNDRDEWNRGKDYNNRVKAAALELAEAVEKGANPTTVGAIVDKLTDAQASNTRDEWDAQLYETFDDELRAICDQPDTLKTKWVLGNIDRDGHFRPYEKIEFWPADITVFCAPTSHGKTMILFQSALDMVRRTDKTYLYVSSEENKRQLVERVLNVYLDIPATPDGLEHNDKDEPIRGAYCFIKGTRKKTIKAVLRGDVPPIEYDAFMNSSEHYAAVSRKVKQGVNAYRDNVRPRLKFIHTDATVESITANLLRSVEALRAEGVEVGGVFVDYMQLLTSENKTFSRTDELKDVCKALKRCAARLEIPVVIAAQLNRQAMAEGIDSVTVANIGEGADIERIAHDIYMLWQVDKTKMDVYFKSVYPKLADGKHNDYSATPERVWNPDKVGDRAQRIFTRDELNTRNYIPKTGYIYIEQLKARDGRTGGWGLFPYDGERGFIGENDTQKMAER